MTQEPDTPGLLDIAMFAGLVGDTFQVSSPAGDVGLELTEASPLRAHAARANDPFALQFQGPPEPQLDQGTHRLEHEQLGAMDIFLVPIGRGPRGILYEAIFN